ncbi:MAG: hypothetical protein JSS27_00570 [Planctomycetes bacterium]|nr:hypothetical protein [Planctomycetota bacterium]
MSIHLPKPEWLRSVATTAGTLLLATSLVGCNCCKPHRKHCPPPPNSCPDHGLLDCDKCASIPNGAIPPPAGTYNCQWQHAQMDRGEASKFVVFQNEWYMRGKTLGPDGHRHVVKIAKTLDSVPYPVVIATSDDEGLDEERRVFVIQALAENGYTGSPERVVVAKPEQEGLYGQESALYGLRRAMGGGMGMGMGGMGGMGGGGMGGMGGGMGMGGSMMGGGMGGMGGGMGMF